jgi:hypothetical protein
MLGLLEHILASYVRYAGKFLDYCGKSGFASNMSIESINEFLLKRSLGRLSKAHIMKSSIQEGYYLYNPETDEFILNEELYIPLTKV